MPALQPLLPAALLAGFAATGAWLDWHRRVLPNWLCLAALSTGLGLAATGQLETGLLGAVLHAGIALLIGMALFAGGLIGGGDAKFYAALAAWFPLSGGFRLLMLVSLAGIVLTVAMWAFSLLRREVAGGARGLREMPRTIPFGVAIAAGAVWGNLW